MFSQEQIDTLYHLVEKGVISAEAVKTFLLAKLAEVGLVEIPPPAPEQPVEPTPEATAEQPPAEGQPA